MLTWRLLVLILAVLGFVLLSAIAIFAGPKEHVAIAEAIVYAAKHKRPALQSDTFQSKPSTEVGEVPLPIDEIPSPTPIEIIQPVPAEEPNPQHPIVAVLQDELETAKEKLNAANYRIMELKLANSDAGKFELVTLNLCDGKVCVVVEGDIVKRTTKTTLIAIPEGVLKEVTGVPVITVQNAGEAYLAHQIESMDGMALFQVDEPIGTPKDTSGTVIAQQRSSSPLLGLPSGLGSLSAPMRLEIPAMVAQPITHTAIEATTYVSEGCAPCHWMQKANGPGDSRVHFTYSNAAPPKIFVQRGRRYVPEDIGINPVTFWQDGDGGLRYHVGLATTDEIYAKICDGRNSPPAEVHQGYAATGGAGAIHARNGIQKFAAILRQRIGEGNHIAGLWDRSEAKLNLFAAKDFGLKDWIGRQGRLQIDAPNAIGLPVKTMAISYDIVGDRIFLDAERFGLELSLLTPKQGYGAAPAQFVVLDDALFIYSVVQLMEAIWGLLHPSADIILPDQISWDCVLNGDTITITFDKSPSICLKWLMTFNLAVKKVVITDSNIHVEFSGSRWIKSRDFDVK
jgi:hypothetical protein